MFQELPVNIDGVVAFKTTGKLTDEDYKAFLPVLEKIIEREGPVSVLAVFEDFQGWEPRAAWDDIKFGLEHARDFKKIAVVGDSGWLEWMSRLSDVFFNARIKFFPRDAMDEALAWLKEEEGQEAIEPLKPYSHILLATDFSPHARRAAERAVELAGNYGAKLSFVYVVEDPMLYDEFYEPVFVEEWLARHEEHRKRAEDRLRQWADELGAREAEIVVLDSTPKVAIPRYADQHDVDLIVAGTCGRRGVKRMLGSVANALVHHSGCDVLTVR